jgi:isocitrate lyase
MSAYVRLQEKEFALSDAHGYSAVRHQRFVGTGYFDTVQTTIAGGRSSTEALAGSTENAQFAVAAGADASCFRPIEESELRPGVSQ